MTIEPWYWIAFTLVAAVLQTGRNATQRGLTGNLGTLGATMVSFVFGLPFGLFFLEVVLAVSQSDLPRFNAGKEFKKVLANMEFEKA